MRVFIAPLVSIGPIPAELGDMAALQVLDLSCNQLSGERYSGRSNEDTRQVFKWLSDEIRCCPPPSFRSFALVVYPELRTEGSG